MPLLSGDFGLNCQEASVLECSYRGCQSSVIQIDLIGLLDILGLHRSLRTIDSWTTDYGLRTADMDSWQSGSPGKSWEVLRSLYIEGQEPVQKIIKFYSILCCAYNHSYSCDFFTRRPLFFF